MGFLKDLVGGITGSTAADAAKKSAAIQQEAAQGAATGIRGAGEALLPFQQVGQQGVDLAGFLTSPEQQASFLEGNPLFELGLQNLNEQTNKSAASRGRLTAGDTLQQLTQNTQLAGQPLIDRQRQDILNLLGIGQNVAGQQIGIENQAQDFLTGGAAANAAGVVGAANARGGLAGNAIDIAGMLSGMFTSASPSTSSSALPSSPIIPDSALNLSQIQPLQFGG